MTIASLTSQASEASLRLGRRRSRSAQTGKEGVIVSLVGASALFSVVTTFSIIFILFRESLRFFHMEGVSFVEFVTGLEWNPLLGAEKHFGVWPLISGTLLVTGIAALTAIPLGLMTAIFLSEYAPRRLRSVLKPVLEVLAGVPTVVYGFFALTVVTPALREMMLWITALFVGEEHASPVFDIYNATSAGLAVGIMCLPIVCSLSEDALQAVPRSLREGAYAAGATKFDVSLKVVTPAALSGIVAASLLAIARAIGETMIVALAAGNIARLSLNPTSETQTMTAYMVQIFLGDTSNFGPEYGSSYAVATALFLMTLIVTMIGAIVLRRYREVYE